MSRRRKSAKRRRKKHHSWRTQLSDERLMKLAGALFLLLGMYMLIACISYLFTWKTDQDKVLLFSWRIILEADLSMANWLGRLGAYVSNMLIYWGFGIPAFLLTAIIGRLGWDLMLRRPLSGFWKLTANTLPAIFYFSIVFEVIFTHSAFAWGGAFGASTAYWLGNFLGEAGLILLLVFCAASFLIWIFNPDFTNLNWPDLQLRWPFSWSRIFPARSKTAFSPAGQMNSNVNEDRKSLKPNFLENFKGTKDTDSAPVERVSAVSKPPETVEFDVKDEEKKENGNTGQAVDTELEIKAGQDVTITEGGGTRQDTGQQQQLFEVEEENLEHTEPYDPTLELASYQFPDIELLNDYSDETVEIDRAELEANKDQIIETLLNYKIEITKIRATIGPTVTLYEIVPAPGIRISKIKNLEDDIALSLSALGIRIIAPIPGRGTIGIEVPNKKKQIVSLREVIQSDKYLNAKMDLPIVLGKTIANEVFVADLAKMPHLLIAGATGQGKSVGINAVLMSLLYKKHPSQVKFVLIDPKKVELFPYSKLDKHFLAMLPDQKEPIVTETKKVIYTLNSLCIEMDDRYDLLKRARVRNIREYNEKFVSRKLNPRKGHRFLPFIILVIDEFADLIMTAGKEIELPIGRLAQLARAVGIHLIIATQRPSVNIITGVIKANFPARIAYKVSSKVDSRTILDVGGAEQLIGRGDMLLSIGTKMIRLQCAYVDTPEAEDVIDFIGDQQGYGEPYLLPEYKGDDEPIEGAGGMTYADLDEMFEDAARLVVQNQHGSTSMLQRRLKLGYNRAGRLMDQLEALGIVGPNEGSKAREVLVFSEMELDHFLQDFKNRN